MRHASAVLILLVACGPKSDADVASTESAPPPALPQAQSAPQAAMAAVYRCDDATDVLALFGTDSSGAQAVSLAINNARVRLRQVQSASGAKYGDSTTSFWNKGDSVTFVWEGTTRLCAVVPAPGAATTPVAPRTGGLPSGSHRSQP